jgi:hypothetical protein
MANPAEELAIAARELTAKVASLDLGAADRQIVLAKQARRNRTMIYWIIGVVAIQLVLAALVGVAIRGETNNTDRLNMSETIGRQKALCPLYQLLIEKNTPKARAAALNKASYDRTYKIINEGYVALNCKEFKGSAPGLG